IIADPTLPTSDPTVLTGSHNWSNAAQFNNDENTVVVHDATIANIYYQEWMRRYTDNGGVYVPQTPNLSTNLQLYPNPASSVLNIVWRSNSTVNYSVSNIMGQMMQSGTINANQTQQIDTNTLPKGMYIVQIGTEAVRFVVQ
ncbi:MAG: T9SS type A sorting domain-containing protein, partial [Chitinophagales bacterium]|nr:T9SS type A sorting domain-containing protein [Chitinophagales bacterium]